MATEIKNLKEKNFALDSKDLVTLKFDDVILVLLDTGGEDDYSKALRDNFIEAGKRAVGPVFAICNLKCETSVASAFMRIRGNLNHPFNWTAGDFPYILVYRDGWPQAIYNGDPDAELIRKYAETDAGQPTYYEKKFIPRDQSDSDTIQSSPLPGQSVVQEQQPPNIPKTNIGTPSNIQTTPGVYDTRNLLNTQRGYSNPPQQNYSSYPSQSSTSTNNTGNQVRTVKRISMT